MAPPSIAGLSRRELRAALDALQDISDACAGRSDFARRAVQVLPRVIASELTTLSVCDLRRNHRSVVSDVPNALSRREIEVFDHYFPEHPLVRAHGRNPRAVTRRIRDLVSPRAFARSGLYSEYYRPLGLRDAMALPVYVQGDLLVSFVLNRGARGFSQGDRELAEALRAPLAAIYRLLPAEDPVKPEWQLTAREREVLHWAAAGKTNRDIAEILGARPRTVEKHLERIYEKLGVETRTAAVLRLFARRVS